MNSKTKRVTTIGMLCAITYATMVVGRIPIILFFICYCNLLKLHSQKNRFMNRFGMNPQITICMQ